MTAKNIYPVFDQILNRDHKERLLDQRSIVIWFTGLSGAGKTTLAKNLERKMHNEGFLTQILDGDNIRSGINNNLTFTEEDRKENIRRIAEVSKLLIHSGVITLNSFISPTKEIRDLAKAIIGRDNFFEVYVNAPLDVCEERDVKGLYQKARNGEIKNFTGIDSPFDSPVDCDIEIRTDLLSVEDGVNRIWELLEPKILFKGSED
jgi:adenylylsulfate kinase